MKHISTLLPHIRSCNRCGHEWLKRNKDKEPKHCPLCKSPYWNKKRVFNKSNMNKELTKKQVNAKYKDRYVKVLQRFDYNLNDFVYTVLKSYKDIHENTTLGQDLGSVMEYRR